MLQNPWLLLAIITVLPGVELRLSIPYGISAGLDPFSVFLFAAVINSLLVFPVFLLLGFLFSYFEKLSFLQGFLTRVRAKTKKYVDRYGFIGLALFVAVPLPGSGAYTGALGAYMLGIPKRKAIPAVIAGVFIAAFLVTAISVGLFSGLLNYV
jgi:uncharacterized membrane protein